MSQRHVLFSIHVLSQLTYKWLFPLPHEDVRLPPLLAMKELDWQHFLRNLSLSVPFSESLDHHGACKTVGVSSWAKACVDHLEACKAARCHVLTMADEIYPQNLRELLDPPLALSCFGSLDVLARPMIAVIGSRKCSGFGLKESYKLGKGLAEQGIAVVSGGALGCDIAAHQGTVACSQPHAKALIVFAGGLKTFYPRQNSQVFRELYRQGGLFISERLWDAVCRPMNFSARNRIISGLCPATIVAQAGARSGALITARMALDQGRDVLCLEHDLFDVRAAGSHALIAEGATGLSSAVQVVDHLT